MDDDTKSNQKDQDTNQASPTCNGSETPFTDGVKETAKPKAPTLEHHRERLREAIRKHGREARSVKAVRAKRRPIS